VRVTAFDVNETPLLDLHFLDPYSRSSLVTRCAGTGQIIDRDLGQP
jgi:hypothetical protein